MTVAHLPGWLADATELLSARYEAEAVLLGGSQARGDATPASDFDLLVLVDEERNTRQGWPMELRFEQLEGYPRPVDFVVASLAEVMAGLFAGHAGWTRFASAIHPVHDPFHMAPRISQRASARAHWEREMSMHLRHEIGRARGLLTAGDTAGAALIAARVVAQLLPAGSRAIEEAGTPSVEQALLSPSVESRLAALERMIAAGY